MKLLILSSNNGQGHNSASKAILECAESRGISGVMIDAMLFESPRKSELYEKLFIKGALHTPSLIEVGNQLAEKIEESGVPSPEYRAAGKHPERLKRFIRDNGFDTVAATHIFSAQMLTYLEEQFRSALTTAFVATDYSYTPFTSETALDAYFLPHPALVAQYEEAAPGKRYFATGIPTSERKLRHTGRQAARAALELPPKRPIALIMTGSMGFGDVVPLVEELALCAPEETLTLVLCGRNEKLLQTLRKADPEGLRVRAVAYTDRVGEYLDAADVLLSKPGGLSSTEAAVKEIPLVHITPMPGWEEENVRFFTARGLSRTGKTPREMARAAAYLLENPDAAERMRQCQRREINKRAASDILDTLESLPASGREG